MTTILGLAINSRGASLAAIDECGNIVNEAHFTPDDLPEDICGWIEGNLVSEVVLEQPKMAPSDVTSSYIMGWWRGLLASMSIPVDTITDDMWQYLVLKTNIKSKRETIVKRAMKFVEEKYGFQRVDFQATKAVCLAHYGCHFSQRRVKECFV